MWVFEWLGPVGGVLLFTFGWWVVLWDREHVEHDRRVEADRRWRESRETRDAVAEEARWRAVEEEDERRRRLLEGY